MQCSSAGRVGVFSLDKTPFDTVSSEAGDTIDVTANEINKVVVILALASRGASR